MTSVVRPTHEQTLAASAQLQEVQRWRAAETVRSHITQAEEREAMLDCLGLTDVTRPDQG
jgi:hypothetical protein